MHDVPPRRQINISTISYFWDWKSAPSSVTQPLLFSLHPPLHSSMACPLLIRSEARKALTIMNASLYNLILCAPATSQQILEELAPSVFTRIIYHIVLFHVTENQSSGFFRLFCFPYSFSLSEFSFHGNVTFKRTCAFIIAKHMKLSAVRSTVSQSTGFCVASGFYAVPHFKRKS